MRTEKEIKGSIDIVDALTELFKLEDFTKSPQRLQLVKKILEWVLQ